MDYFGTKVIVFNVIKYFVLQVLYIRPTRSLPCDSDSTEVGKRSTNDLPEKLCVCVLFRSLDILETKSRDYLLETLIRVEYESS